MPELPEVEIACRALRAWLEKTTIEKAAVIDARILDQGVSATSVVRRLAKRRILSVDRRGKWMRLVLDRGRVFSHLGMTGKWLLAPEPDSRLRFEKVRLDVTRGRTKRSVRYLDPRLFGRFVVSDEDIPAWTELGPDPLTDGIDVARFAERLRKRSLPIKAVLLDQTVLAGVGNIQATEALFFAGVDPRTPAQKIAQPKVTALARAIKRSIARTLAAHEGEEGPIAEYVSEGADNPFVIYGRGGDPCPKCKTALSKIMLAGRGTVFCRTCQGR